MPFIINSLTVRKDRISAVHFYITFESLGKALKTLQLLNILPYVVYRQYSEWVCKLHPFSRDMQCDSVRPRQCPPETSRRGMVALAQPRLTTVLPCTVPVHSPAVKVSVLCPLCLLFTKAHTHILKQKNNSIMCLAACALSFRFTIAVPH